MKRTLALMCLAGFFPLGLAACAPQAGQSGGTTEGAATEQATAAPTKASASESTGPAADVMAFQPAKKGGELVIGQGQEPDTLYIHGGSMLAASHVLNSIYDGPIEGLSYDYQPVILEKLPKIEDEGSGATLETVSVKAGDKYVDPESQEVVTATAAVADLQQITARFTIKDGVKWQDGTPVTADDSVFGSTLACDKDTPTTKFTCERTASYKKIDDRTVEWKGLPGFTDQTYYTNFYTPLPRHQKNKAGKAMSEVAPKDILKDETFTRSPYSYGPFMIQSWTAGDNITLVRNPNYWRAKEGLPFLDKVVHKIYPDSNTLVAALKTGEAQVGTQDGLDISQFDALEGAMQAGELKPYYVVGTVWEHIDFNLNPVDGRVPLGACKDIRHAMIQGTDRQTMVDQIQKGKTRVQHTFVPEEHWAYPPEGSLVKYAFDKDAAGKALDDLGFTGKDSEGYRVAAKDITCDITTGLDGKTKTQTIPKGTKLELKLNTTAGNQMRQDTTLLFQQNMKDIGVKVNLDYLDAKVFFQDGPDGPLFGRRFDLGQFAWLTGVQPPVNLYYCTEIPSEANKWAGQNQTGWCNPDYDKAGKKASTTLKRADSLPLYQEAQKLFTEDLPVIPLFARVKVMATAPNLVNFAPNPTVNSETWNIETWGYAEGTESGAKAGATTGSSATSASSSTTTGATATP
jgi:peptide/nickel transport system substrate-binding protein